MAEYVKFENLFTFCFSFMICEHNSIQRLLIF